MPLTHGLGKTDIQSLRAEITQVMIDIRKTTTNLTPAFAGEVKAREQWEGNLYGKPARRFIIYLRSSGCSKAMNSNNGEVRFKAGCLDCEHSVADTTLGIPIPTALYMRQFESEFHKWDFSRFPILCVYNEGNFFNEAELPVEAREGIFRIIAQNGHVKRLIVESLPEYITDERLARARELLRDVELEIGIGLESSDFAIRSLCVNKPYTLNQYEQVVPKVRKHARLLAYVLLKPSFLSEKEALDDTLETVKYAFRNNADAVSIEPLSVGTYTMSGVLHRLGLYKPAWLWTVLEVAKKSAHLGEIRIGGYQFAPSYKLHAHNCEVCTGRIKASIRDFNESYDKRHLMTPECSCIKTWESELQHPHDPLDQRIRTQLSAVRKSLQNSERFPITRTL